MKALQKIVVSLFVLLLCLSPGAGAYAEEPDGASLPFSCEGKSWDEVMEALLESYALSPDAVAAGYYNLLTGEEHYFNPDEYMVAASMYKLPLCMYYAEHIHSGELDWSNYAYSFEDLRDRALIDSSNDAAITLWDILGGYWKFRSLTAEYMGVEPGTEETWLYDQNMYTARQFITCLRTLYEEPERFPDVLDTLRKAEPERFFRLNERRFDIAHKYGSFNANLNDCGIVFTEEPIAIVLFTRGVQNAETVLSAYCTAMCSYEELHKPVPTPEPTPPSTPVPAAPSPTAAPEAEAELVSAGFPPIAAACIAAGTILFVLIVIRMTKKNNKRFFCFFLALLLSAALLPLFGLTMSAPAYADEPDASEEEWASILRDLMVKYDVEDDAIRIGYLNLVTGEEHYYLPDEEMTAGSMYKLPLCMYFAEGLQNGTVDWSDYEQYFRFEDIRDRVLIESDNDQAGFLLDRVGGYENFRTLTAPYLGEDPGDYRQSQNVYTARELITCLKTLYTERERFPGIIETLQQAEPDRFFKLNEPRFRIAHKYGYLDGTPYFMNDCGLCFTTEPIAIVAFTRSLSDPENFLTDYCTAMCEYTERLVSKPTSTPEPTAAPTPAPAPAPTPSPDAEPVQPVSPLIPVAFVALFAVAGLVLVITLCVKYRARFLGLFLALLFSAAAMLLAVVGMQAGTIYAKPSGDPADTVTAFFDAVCSGDYDRAYEQLRDYSDLGLASVPSSAAGQKIFNALHESYAYELVGECRSDKLNAVQNVRFTYLNLPSLEADVAEQTQLQIERIVQTRSVSEVYDQNKHFLPEVAEEAYLAALDTVLQNAEAYYTDDEFELGLNYIGNRWQLLASPALLRALNGGTGT